MGEIEIHAENAARVDVKPVAERKRRVLVEPAEKFFLRPERRVRRNGLHPSPRGAVAIPPPEFRVEVETPLFARAIEECPRNVNDLRVVNGVEDLIAGIDWRIVVAKEILPRHVRRHVVHVILERQLDVLVLEFHIENPLVLAAVDIADFLDMADDALFALVPTPFRKVEVDHLRDAGAIAPGMVALMLLLGPVHRERRALEIKIRKPFKGTRYQRIRADVNDAIDVRIFEVAVEKQLEIRDIAAAMRVNPQRHKFFLKSLRIHNRQAIVDLGMHRLERIELLPRTFA